MAANLKFPVIPTTHSLEAMMKKRIIELEIKRKQDKEIEKRGVKRKKTKMKT